MTTYATDPAFPHLFDKTLRDANGRLVPHTINTPGLTKRELFAAMAMQGMLQKSATMPRSEIVEHAVGLADALIKELEEK